MANSAQIELGSVVSLWRYPVKSMMGEELNATEVTERGLLGDRAYALIDRSDGKAATAKNPRKWPQLFDFRATFIEPAGAAAKAPPVRIALPDGTTVTSEQGDVNQILSKALNREVELGVAQRGAVNAEEYWPDMEGLDHRDTVTDFTLPEGTFFDCAMVHLLTTTTLDRLRALYPQVRVVLISAYPDREFHRQGLEAGAVAFLDKKDLDVATLRQVVDDVITTAGMENPRGEM